jgi:hypothetical protein
MAVTPIMGKVFERLLLYKAKFLPRLLCESQVILISRINFRTKFTVVIFTIFYFAILFWSINKLSSNN